MTRFWLGLSLAGWFVIVAIAWRIHLLGSMGVGQIPLWDFDAYYLLAQDVRQGIDPGQVTHMQTLGPPLVIAPFVPFTFFSLATARMWFIWSNILAWAVAVVMLARRWWPRSWWVAAPWLGVVLVSSFPARFTLIVGQPHGWLTLVLTIFLLAKKSWLVGLGWALATWIKTFWVGLGVALVRGGRPSLSWGILIIAGLITLTLPLIRPSFYQTFITQKNQVLWQVNQAQDVDYYNQSLKATLQRWGWAQGYVLVWLGLAVSLGYFVTTSGSRPGALLVSLALSPVLWQHYVVVLFPVLVWLWTRKNWRGWQRVILVVASWAWWVEFPQLHGQAINFSTGLMASHYFWSILLMLVLTVSHHSTHRGSSASVS